MPSPPFPEGSIRLIITQATAKFQRPQALRIVGVRTSCTARASDQAGKTIGADVGEARRAENVPIFGSEFDDRRQALAHDISADFVAHGMVDGRTPNERPLALKFVANGAGRSGGAGLIRARRNTMFSQRVSR
ncbi:hypothetical protein AB4Z43_04570 [Mesorhizobium sp. 2RAF45]|uniref:hypothetical protein n=1 Tax=Mesorhizobium sp. 2RAF45 TaxID=3233001 RepID=UPI003F9770A0